MLSCQLLGCPWALPSQGALIIPCKGHMLGVSTGHNFSCHPQQTFATISLPLMGFYGLGDCGFLFSRLAGTEMAGTFSSHVALPLGGYAYQFPQLTAIPMQVPLQRQYCP